MILIFYPGKDGIKNADFIDFPPTSEYQSLLNEKLSLEITNAQFPLLTLNHLVHWQLVKQGLGIGIMTTDVGDIENQVVAVQPNKPTIKGELWLVTHRELRTNFKNSKSIQLFGRKTGLDLNLSYSRTVCKKSS